MRERKIIVCFSPIQNCMANYNHKQKIINTFRHHDEHNYKSSITKLDNKRRTSTHRVLSIKTVSCSSCIFHVIIQKPFNATNNFNSENYNFVEFFYYPLKAHNSPTSNTFTVVKHTQSFFVLHNIRLWTSYTFDR